jgi:lipopolysaccharide export system permease protein
MKLSSLRKAWRNRSWRIGRATTPVLSQYTRYMCRSYARNILWVAMAFLTIALTMDLSPRVAKIAASAPQNDGFSAALAILRYSALRSIDILDRLLIIATFFGALMAEVVHIRSRERITVWNAGRSPLQCIVPALIVGTLAGALQFTLDVYGRPAAVMTQIAERLGDYGDRFGDRTTGHRWFVSGNDVFFARIEFGPIPVLRDVTVYRLTEEGRLHELISAETARPTEDVRRWAFSDGMKWQEPGSLSAAAAEPNGPAFTERQQKRFAMELVELNLDPVWINNFQIFAKLLPQSVLLKLAKTDIPSFPTFEYRTWVQVRYAQAFLPVVMALLACTFSMLLMRYKINWNALFRIALVGYAGHVNMKVFVMLGERGWLPAPIAAWFTPIVWFGIAAMILCITEAIDPRQLLKKWVSSVPHWRQT